MCQDVPLAQARSFGLGQLGPGPFPVEPDVAPVITLSLAGVALGVEINIGYDEDDETTPSESKL